MRTNFVMTTLRMDGALTDEERTGSTCEKVGSL